MTDLDDRLKASLNAPLSKEDEEFLNSLDTEQGLFQQLGGIFSGPMKGWVIVANIVTLIATAVGLWAVWQMFQTETTRGLILWAAAGWAAWTIQIALKQWLWDRMNMLTLMREMKRIELRLAQLEKTV